MILEWTLDIYCRVCSPDGPSIIPREGCALKEVGFWFRQYCWDAGPGTYWWQAGAPGGRVVTAGTYADITVVNLGGTQAMGGPWALQFFILLPP